MTPANNLPTIGVNIIMKNEAEILPRFLESVLPIIDSYCIVDTGSTDSSREIVRNFFDSKGIKGGVFDFPKPENDDGLLNFCAWRNYALEKAKGIMDYGFLIGCDETIVLSKGFDKNVLKRNLSKYDFANISVKNGDLVYDRSSFFKLSKNPFWKHRVHEGLYSYEPSTSKTGFISDFKVVCLSDGNSWKQGRKEKYQRYIAAIKKDVEEHNDPRDVFYLAQSYKDAGESKEAIEWYEKRTAMEGGLYEERYYSRLMIAGLKWTLGYPLMEVIDEYWRCGELDELRAEHLYFLEQVYAKNGRPNSAKKVRELRLKYKNPHPARMLFVDSRAYSK